MDFFIFWLGSSVVSLVIQFSNKLNVFKNIADNGYKFDFSHLQEPNQKEFQEDSKNAYIPFFIPVVNVWYAFAQVLKYEEIKDEIFDHLKVMGLLEKMTELELEEYLKKPTGVRALLLPLFIQDRVEQEKYLEDKTINEILSEPSSSEISDTKNEVNCVGDTFKGSIQERKDNLEMMKHELLVNEENLSVDSKNTTLKLVKKRKNDRKE